jgi:uncharacterized protein DUF5686/carboxypeptidase-like protein
MKKRLLLFLLIISASRLSAQKIYGTVYTDKGDLLPYSSITIKGTTTGSSANSNAHFSIMLSPGTYTLVCQHIGYSATEKKITIDSTDVNIAFVLNEQKLVMQDVIVKANREDPAYAIIRHAIKKRSYYEKQVNAFECNLYTKDLIKLCNLPDKIMGRKIPGDRKQMGLDSSGRGIIYLSESLSHVASQKKPDEFKMDVLSSRVSGSKEVGLTFPTFINFYKNNVDVFQGKLNPRGFISPIADGALGFYKYKYLGSFWEDGKEINSIRIIPKRNYEPLFSGVINISEDDWRIHSIDVILSQTAQLELLDTLQITQLHTPATTDIWQVKNQVLYFKLNQLGISLAGDFVSVYSNYVIDPVFPKKYFDNVVVKYDTAASTKSKAYWDSTRPVPLEKEEVKDYQVKDSIYDVRNDSVQNSSVIDSLNKGQGKLKLYNVVAQDIDRMHYGKTGKYNWGIHALIEGLEYNTVEGIALTVMPFFDKYLKRPHAALSIEPNFRYGFNNTHVNTWVNIDLRIKDPNDRNVNRHIWKLSGGKRISQFNKSSPITPIVNSLSTLYWGDNFMKLYENYFLDLGYSKKFKNALKLSIDGLYEDRIPVNNTTNFTFFKKDSSSITPNYPYEQITAQFPRHQAFIISVDLSIKPGQKYIEFPHYKVSLGSKYPLFSFNYTKGFKNILGSDVDFDKWKFMVSDDVNLKLAGTLKYNIGAGGFLNSNTVFIQDYQHFNGNRTINAGAYLNSFQMAGYYQFSTTANLFGVGHLEHHFDGLLTNKIPLFKKLDWNLVAGSNALYINNTHHYTEAFIGLENIFKIFRVDFIEGYQYGRPNITGVCIGTGGLFGNNFNPDGTGQAEGFGF